MIRIKKYFFLSALAGSLLSSCTKNFESVNTDPNNPKDVTAGALLNPILYQLTSYNTKRSDDFTFDIMQVRLPWPSNSGGIHRYVVSDASGNGSWNTYYSWMTNINDMIQIAEKTGKKNYKAIGLVLKAWNFANLTDCFGDIPMSEANRAEEGIMRPKFDRQQDIYPQLLSYLETANNLFDVNEKMEENVDLLYQNKIENWKRFGNSLRLRLLLRISNRTETKAGEQMAAIIANPAKYPVFNDNSQAALLRFTGAAPNLSPWGRAVDFTTTRCAGEFFVNTLNDFNDPRREKMLSRAQSLDGKTDLGFKGIPSGYSGDAGQFKYNPSNMLVALATAPLNGVMMSYAEVELIKAELAQKGIIAEDAKTHYEKGVKAAIEQWGATMPDDYFTNTAAAYDGTLDRIMLQKYCALFFTDYQQWFEYRRTGLPVLPKGDGMLNGKVMPVRFKYPATVQITNPDNYKSAVAAMGGDDINTKVWWEKK
ncbi:SusD/RagB family nutrient-binding outer membrane lipoprotein [Chitinophaga nivalis]|uniref:SusD/RagB family nutrient-binding outer membrane lipoprotein n=1 Tax=Chitinophaga nivalis TaxID=2991709 RepID=A0ABT3IHZ6_9BACT|nr:SusD/RagB family nutrient-binding outer membrane lipoprotein [Chitinophaga nivalis]MCW3466732.1 SusD/RagB family nutrient-binding outer membrane lipoprotein [Chitinophaga nivalis]MCW3483577.1 SusD/RagB family nutrient-binding outer membrane lipoprotein [Chitinophaga nivalis]